VTIPVRDRTGSRHSGDLDVDVYARLKMMKITVFLLLSTYFCRNVAVKTKYRRIIFRWMLEKWIVKM
jgi:hypothetical protein